MNNLHENLADHIIVCGGGAIGQQIIEELENYRQRRISKTERRAVAQFTDYILVDCEERVIKRLHKRYPEMNFIIGDATDDSILEQAGIGSAFGLFAALPSEKDNLYVTITAHLRNPGTRIIARSSDPTGSGSKLLTAGAKTVVSPNFIGGLRLVSELARPSVTTLLDAVMHHGSLDLQVLELTVGEDSEVTGKSLSASGIRQNGGTLVVAIRKKGNPHYLYNPKPSKVIEAGDTLVVLASSAQRALMQKITQGSAAPERNSPVMQSST